MCKFELKQHAEQAVAPRIDLSSGDHGAITARSHLYWPPNYFSSGGPASTPSLLFRRGRPRHCDSLAFRDGLSGFAIRGTGLADHPARNAGSLPFYSNELHQLAPLLGFICDELAEVSSRARKGRTAQLGKPRLNLGIGKARIDLFVERFDDPSR